MALYTFHSYRADGSPVSLDSFDLRTEAEAMAKASSVLAEHGTAAFVVVCLEEVELATIRRPGG